jgi:class 3 adenylate cyclase
VADVHQVSSGHSEDDRSTAAKSGLQRRLAAIVCADIVGYSRLVGVDEAGSFRRVKALRAEVLEPLVAEHGGRIVSYAGDGALAEFPSVVRAVECALAIQSAAAEREPDVPLEWRLTLRIGIHSGDILVDHTNDLCGDAVNIAVRLEKLAEPGGICLSDHAYEELAGRIDAAFAYGGEPPLKNIGRGIGVWFWPPGDHGGRAPDLTPALTPAARNAWRNPRPNARWPEIFGSVPPRDLNFIGREEALSILHRLLTRSERRDAITQVAIHGLGGIGKTTLAAQYAHRHAGEYAGVWWVPAETRAGLLASLVDLAGRLDARLAEESDQEKAAQAGLAHLARSGVPYLLVYDNVETPEVLCEPYRVYRRLQLLRGWSHDEAYTPLFSRGPRSRGANGSGPPRRARLAVCGHPVDRGQDRMLG